ncbi:MaoC/PaaZ C-terminal domain-containing protein [Knoellia koreensis]|uniref:MaoC/PaaZ C-terminal domain-containing protein n=1 Tax=Knoellia koreensis TaxID=2730921 RepID=UPI003211F579
MPESTSRVLTESPSLAPLFVKAALTSRGRGGALPDTVLRREAVQVDRDHLLAYQRICRFTGTDVLPPTYPHVLGFPLQVSLMSGRDFPLPLPGLVHLENRIVVHRQLTADDRLDISVHAEQLASHPKGQVVDLVTEVDVAGQRVWEGRSTYLRRGRGGDDAAYREKAPALPDRPPAAVLRLPEDLGRRYAAVSGDVNPIHLHPLTAKAMGFPRAIAHGMWTYARTLAALGPKAVEPGESSVWFGKPVLLPNTVEVVVDPDASPLVAGLRSRKDASKVFLTLTLS